MATKTITTPYQWAAVKGSNTNYTQTYSFTNTTGKAITIKSIKVSLAEYPGKGNSGNLYTWEESSSNDRKSFTTSRNPRTTEYGGYDTRAEAETAGNNGFKKYLYNYLNESTEHISSIDLSQTDYMQLTEIEIGGTNIGITAQNIKNTATGVKNTYTFDTSNVNYEIREAVISGEIVYSAVWTSGKATIKSGRLDSGGKDYAFSCEKLVASGASANVLITVNNPNANWAAVKFGSVTITYDSYDPTFPDNGPYYPWVKGYNGTDWKLPKANIVSGIGDYKVRTSSGVWKPALASKDNYVYEAERGWIKYQKYINLPGTEGQHFDLADDKRFNLIAGNSVEFDISMPYQLVSGHGYMLLESHNSSGNLRIGVYSNDGSSMYAYLKNTVGTATEIRTPESGHGVLQPNTRYKIVYGKDSSNAYIRVFDEFGDLYTEVTGTVNNFTGSTATRLFNDVSLSSEDRNFKGYCYYFKVNNDIFDIDCCSVGYDHIKQTNYNEAGEFESDSYLANDIHTIVEGEWVEKPVEPDKPWMPLRFTANTNNSTVELTKVGNPSIANTAYSLDGYTWTTFTPGEVGSNTITLAHAGDKVYFRNDINGNFDETNCLEFVMSGSIAAAGNVNSIYSSTAFIDLTELSYVYCYGRLFYDCESLTIPPLMTATTLSDHCYEGMFWGCSSLTAAPELPATTLAPYCYSKMFVECTSLTSPPELRATTLAEYCYKHMFGSCLLLDVAPELPATTLSYGCYWAMFDSCPSLKVAPELPATTLADHCYYYMFYGCTSLTTPPELQATILEDYCYGGMFCGCISLTTSPELKATTLASSCYRNMFYDCSALSTPPELPATTLSDDCYRGMFYRCTSLASPSELPATTLASGCYWAMFYGCTSLTNSPELKATTLSSDCYRGMFSGCTSLATSPALPATTLASGCYWSMFYGCTSLTTPPELPATTLSSDCYRSMFSGCTSLQVSDTQTEAAQYVWTIPESGIFTNTTTYNQLYMFTNCLGTRSSDTMSGAQGESHTYYTQNEPV